MPLVRRALAGDQKAFAGIMERYDRQLYHLMYKMVRSKEESEDLVQEAFIKAFNALHTFNDDYAFSTWLYKIAVNNCIDFLRKKRLQTFSYDKPVAAKDGEMRREYPDPESVTDKAMLASEKTGIINHAIENLPEKYKTAIVLRHHKEFSYEEIAQHLNLPLGTVKARIFRAREMLKRKLKGKILP